MFTGFGVKGPAVHRLWGERTTMFKSTQLESYNVQSLCDLVCKPESVKNGAKRNELAMETDLRVKTRMRGSSFWGE